MTTARTPSVPAVGTSLTPAPAGAVRRWPGLLGRTVAAIGSGVLLYLSFPPRGWWWLALGAFALLGIALHNRRVRAGLGYGGIAGLAFFAPLLVWTGEYVGPAPWIALVVLQAVFVAVAGAGIALVSRLSGWPLWAGAMWVLGEALRARVPFGGFPWGKVAFGQPDGPFLALAAAGGTSLVGLATAVAGFGLGTVVLAARGRRPGAAARAVAWTVVPVLAGIAAGPLVWSGRDDGTATVAVVQGNVPRLGLDFNSQRRAVLDNHVRRTEQLAADVAAGRVPRPELVIWPENASDIDPFRNPDARAAIDRATAAVGVPILVGAVATPPDGGPRNVAVRWVPGEGPTGTYVKRRIQPFGEYIPLRSLVRLFSSDVDKVRRDMMPGTDPAVLQLGPAAVGVATCYEVAFDDTVADSVLAGAQLLAVPSNNATFGLTEMTFQQLAMSRIRAVEHGRAVLVAATSGVSAVVLPDGRIVQQTGQFTADALVAQVPLRSAQNPATTLGPTVEAAVILIALAAAADGLRRRRTDQQA